MALTGLLGPGLFGLTFSHFIAKDRVFTFPGAPFYLAAGLLVIAASLALKLARPAPQPAQGEAPEQETPRTPEIVH
jgi:DHA1 family tetracycline resistance protein-like MFS transporter